MTSRPEAPQRTRSIVAMVLTAVALLAAACGGSSSSGIDIGAEPIETSEVSISGDALPVFDFPDEAVGSVAPTVNAKSFNGDVVTVTPGDGVVRLYGFFAHWCPHCQAEVPTVVEWMGSGSVPDGVEVVAISTNVQPGADNYPPSAWFEKEQWPGRVLTDSDTGAIAASFGLNGFPFWVAVDSEGQVVERLSGQVGTFTLEQLIAKAIG